MQRAEHAATRARHARQGKARRRNARARKGLHLVLRIQGQRVRRSGLARTQGGALRILACGFDALADARIDAGIDTGSGAQLRPFEAAIGRAEAGRGDGDVFQGDERLVQVAPLCATRYAASATTRLRPWRLAR
jgi:hypothetical protein